MPHTRHNIGVAEQIGKYSDALETAPNMRWLYTSGTPGLLDDKQLPPNITGQAELAWQHILSILRSADMGIDDIVKVTQYLTHTEDIADYAKVRSRVLGDARSAFMLLVVPQLI